MDARIALLLSTLWSCNRASEPAAPADGDAPSGGAAAPGTEAPGAEAPAVPSPAAASQGLAEARTPAANATDWGHVFWREGEAGLVGGGTILFGPKLTPAAAAPGGPGGPCGGRLLVDAPEGVALAGPATDPLPVMAEAPAVQSSLVETLAWRIDEALPPRDRFTPAGSSVAPSEQRGVQVGSAIKVRRTNAPPVMLAVGVRDCNGAVIVTPADASERIDAVAIPNACDRLKLLPPTDLDGDGYLETLAWNDDRATLLRLVDDGRTVRLEPLADWTCPAAP